MNRVYNQLMEPTSYSQLDKGEAYGPAASTRNPYIFELREYQAMPQKITNITDRFGGFTCEAFAQRTIVLGAALVNRWFAARRIAHADALAAHLHGNIQTGAGKPGKSGY